MVHFFVKSDNSLAFWSIGASKVTTVSHIGAVCMFEKLKSDGSLAVCCLRFAKVTTVSHFGAVYKFENLKSDDSIAYRSFRRPV